MTDLAIKNTTSSQLPKKTLYFYRRIHQGRKNLFAPSDTAPADYFILNRIPHKHHWTWTPTFHRGDNPKYTPSTVATSRARRSSWWSSFRIWLGDGVDEVLRNEARVRARKKVRFGKRAWKFLGARKKAQAAREEEEGLEEEKEVLGLVMLVKMRRKGVWSRTAEWEVDGVGYRWSGTRRFMTGWMKGVKGWSHDLKRRSNHALIATFQKGRWSSYSQSIKSDGPPNKKKVRIGKLEIYDYAPAIVPLDDSQAAKSKQQPNITVKADDFLSRKGKKLDKDLNLHGSHSGNLVEEAIVTSCWIAVEAERRLRYKILDLLEEIGEQLEGGG